MGARHELWIARSKQFFGPTLQALFTCGPNPAKWLHPYTELLAPKRGLATGMHSGDRAFDELPHYFLQRLGPTLGALLQTATASGEIRADIHPKDLLDAIAHLCQLVRGERVAYSQRMVGSSDGLRYAAADTLTQILQPGIESADRASISHSGGARWAKAHW